jgi:hypothetical protein
MVLDNDNGLKRDVKRKFWVVVSKVWWYICICEKSWFIVGQFNKGEKGAVMGIICRGWDVDDLVFIRACSQRKASCCAAG